jgi:subtilisin family serine protease
MMLLNHDLALGRERNLVPTTAACRLEPLEPRHYLSHSAAHPAPVPWVPFATMIGQDQAVANFPKLNGKGVGVAIIDRGIDTAHPQLQGADFAFAYNFRDNDTTALDDYGHGTGVAGILAARPFTYAGLYDQGVATGAKYLDLKQESSANIKSALDWVVQNRKKYNIQVVNLTDFVGDVLPLAWDPTVYLPELQTLHDAGVVIVTPVGNGASLPIQQPALSPDVIGVGGVNQSDQYDPTSRVGTGTDLVGPAVDVTLPDYTRNPKSHGFDQFDDNYDGTAILTSHAVGTSWASAYVAGAATLLKQINKKLTPDQILQILQSSGESVTDPTGHTVPRLNLERAIELTYTQLHMKLPKKVKAALAAAKFSTTPVPQG